MRATADGSLDLDDLDQLLARHAGRVGLLAVTGASNVTGVVPPVHDLAERVHAVGGRILVDAAQLAAHRPDRPASPRRPRAPRLRRPVRPQDVRPVRHRCPDRPAGRVPPRAPPAGRRDGRGRSPSTTCVWADLPDREEGGSPNVVGAVALAAAVSRLATIGLDRIADHEQALTAVRHRRGWPGCRGSSSTARPATTPRGGRSASCRSPSTACRTAYVAAVLGHEHGIGVRSGCFCAQPYVAHLLSLAPAEDARRRRRPAASTGWCGSASAPTATPATSTGSSTPSQRVAAGAVRCAYCNEPDGSWASGAPTHPIRGRAPPGRRPEVARSPALLTSCANLTHG